MTKIQIGWKAKNEDKSWWFLTFDYYQGKKPEITKLGRSDIWITHSRNCSCSLIENHPEQPEIDWKDSLQPVYIEVEDE